MKNKASLKLFIASLELFLLLVFISSNLFSQTITFERTDVKGGKADFVTANHTFGIDIKIEGIENCSNVAFELSHNLVQYVRLDEYQKSEDWGKGVTIIAEPAVDNAADITIIPIQAGTGFPADVNSPNNPKIIHLEFVVAPEAIHSRVLEFSISKVRATLFRDSIVELIIPTTFRIPYRVHSFVEVWPGDVNCNGLVDADDWSFISLYVTEPRMESRGFKRQNPSVLWVPQMCIAWDTLAATYADCDGNGFVTASDYAIIDLNMFKSHNSNCNPAFNGVDGIVDIVEIKEHINQNDFEITDKTIEIPINIDLTEISDLTGISIIGAAGIIDYNLEPNIKMLGMKVGEFFGNNNLFHYYINPRTNMASFCISTNDKQSPDSRNNVVAYLYIEAHNIANEQINKAVTDFIGFDAMGNVKSLSQSYTSIPLIDSAIIFTVKYSSGNILIENQNIVIDNIQVLNILGSSIADFSYNRNNIYNVGFLPIGMYFIIVSNQQEIFKTKFFVVGE